MAKVCNEMIDDFGVRFNAPPIKKEMKHDVDYKWHNVLTDKDFPEKGKKVLVATLYIEDGKLIRDYDVASYHGTAYWDGCCDTDVVTHWKEIEGVDSEKII